jgi:ABC-type antimicrobial peptide transport system permease subunit
VLRRSRADLPVVLASWALLASALSLLAAGTLYTDAVTLAGLHRELLSAPAADRAIVVRTKILPDRLPTAAAAVVPELRQALASTGGEVAEVLHSSAYADAAGDPETLTDLTQLASFQGIEDHAALVDGRWPTARQTPIEATLSQGAAAALGVRTGDTLSLVNRLDANRRVDVVITGTWRADPADAYWLADSLAIEGSETSGRFTTRGPLVVAGPDLTTGALSEALDAQWRAIPDVNGFDPDSLDAVAADVRGLAGRVNAALPGSNQASVATKLPDILASVDRSVLVAQAGILLLLVQFGVLAAYAVILVAALLLERRRSETALLRSRGAGTGHLAAMALGEALLVVVPAAIAAPWLAMLLVQAVRLNPAMEGVGLTAPLPGPATFATAALGGVIALIALTIPTLLAGVRIAGVRASIGRQAGRTLPQRLGLDLALIVLAVIAMLQLRLYGATLTRNARGTLGVDPLLVAAPAIGLVGGAVLAIRIVPRLAELGERALARTRGLIASLGSRQVARRPLRYTRAALLLILAAALGTFASAHAATWTQSQADQAAWTAGSDVRMSSGEASDIPAWALGGALRAVPGVSQATPVVKATVDLGSTIRGGTLVAIDGAAMADVVRLRDDAAGAATMAALRALGEARPGTPGLELPAGTRRVALTYDSAFTPMEGFAEVPAGFRGLTAAVTLVDGDGRVARIVSEPGPVGVDDATIVIPLTSEAGGELTRPVHLIGLDLGLSIADIPNGLAQGEVALTQVATSQDPRGDAWTPVDLAAAGGRWMQDQGGTRLPLTVGTGPTVTLPVEGLSQFFRYAWIMTVLPRDPAPLPAIVDQAFLDRTGAQVGEPLRASVFGVPVTLDLIARADAFPPLDQTKPFVVVDGLSLDLARTGAGGSIVDADEWWLAAEPGQADAVAGALRSAPISADDVVDKAAVTADLAGDPLGLGVIGILGLGSLAALVFASIGFLVSATVSISERIGEFALLKALGLSPRQLLLWLSIENLMLLATGLILGTLLGLLLAYLVLPFATLTPTGEPPVPAPVIVVPAEAALPTVALAAVLVLATVLLAVRQLPGARTSAVLRARDE